MERWNKIFFPNLIEILGEGFIFCSGYKVPLKKRASNNSLVRWKSSVRSRLCTQLVGAHARLYWQDVLSSHKHEGRWVRVVRPSVHWDVPDKLDLGPNEVRVRDARGGREQPRTCSDTMYPTC